ncbi:MAG: kelch repeat-containing protein [Acidobacteriota bacterium]
MRTLAFLLTFTSLVFAQEGRFVPTGKLTTPRESHAAILLKDGRVLITGGIQQDQLNKTTYLATAELYDPVTGTFRPTGSMLQPHYLHVSTLLADGRVLIAGGFAQGNAPPPAELYDPASGSFSPAGIPTAKESIAGVHAILLPTGKVLLTGLAGLYDPANQSFTSLGKIDSNSGAVLLPDGRLVATSYDSVSLYDLKSDSVTLLDKKPLGSSWLHRTTTLLSDGSVLIAGGDWDYGEQTTWEALVYNPRDRSTKTTGILLIARDSHRSILLPGGQVLVIDGYNSDGYSSGQCCIAEAELYDPVDGQFHAAALDIDTRQGHTATLLQDGRVLVTGGRGRQSASLYIPQLRATSAASPAPALAPGSLASLFGSQLASVAESANLAALPISLGGSGVKIRDGSGTEYWARLLFASPTQLNFEMPPAVQPGGLTITVSGSGGSLAATGGMLTPVAPALFTFDGRTPAAYALRYEPDGKTTVVSTSDPIALDSRPVYLTLYATGLRNRTSLATVQCEIGGVNVPIDYAGPEGSGIPGLDQVNLRLPASLRGCGIVDLTLTVDGFRSNVVTLEFANP